LAFELAIVLNNCGKCFFQTPSNVTQKSVKELTSILDTTFPVLSLQQSIAGLLQLETSGRVLTAACMCSFHLKMDFYSFGVDYMVLNGKNMGFQIRDLNRDYSSVYK